MQSHATSYDLTARAWASALPPLDSPRTLVLGFGAPELIDSPAAFGELAKAYPRSLVIGCSSAGEIHGTRVRDHSLAVTVTRFDKTDLQLASLGVTTPAESFAAGQTLAKRLVAKPGLRGVLILSEGLHVNGSELIRGINAVLDDSIVVTGGLSGDGAAFKRTWVAIGGKLESNVVAAVGFYGDHVVIGHGSKGGWDKFGPERVVTRSVGNVLYELDGKPALALYKEYLGDKAKDLPASGLLFPLALRADANDDKLIVRTLLAVDHTAQSLTFAGDVPTGQLARLMKADFERLIDGAGTAGSMTLETGAAPPNTDSLVVAISCVGRRLVLGPRIEEEMEAVRDAIANPRATLTGFYSYGEISPFATGHCDLHNQTMTLTSFSEAPTALARPAPTPTFENTNTELAPLASRASLSGAGFAIAQLAWDCNSREWSAELPPLDSPRTLVLGFGAPELMDHPAAFGELARMYPRSLVIGCSSAGEIHGTRVRDHSLAVTVTRFDKTELQLASLDVRSPAESFATGQTLAKRLVAKPGLRGVLILSEGLHVNGSELIRGLNAVLDESIVVTGGLSGDGAAFKRTWVAIGGKLKSDVVAAIGFYGDHIVIGHGSKGGWDKFGPERVVTRAEGNVLYELDGRPALELYKEYLGDKAKDLPASGLLFPLALRVDASDEKLIVRTLLSVDHAKNSMTFAGDVANGQLARLMKADFERLIDGAGTAGAMTIETAQLTGLAPNTEALVVAISCVGRRLVLGPRIEEEMEAVRDSLGSAGARKSTITGFYSYGEISPFATGHCDLHNQTMTLTSFSESPTVLARPARPARGSAPSISTTHTQVPQPQVPARPRIATRTPPAGPITPQVAAATGRRTIALAPAPIAASLSAVRTSHPLNAQPAQLPRGPIVRVPRAIGTDAAIEVSREGELTLVHMRGRLTESFKGEALGRSLVGRVVFDLGEVDRVTSFGVREWLAMLGAARMTELHFVRCSESVVNQLAMIRKFDGNAKIVSFYAPYLCTGCSSPIERLLDLERDAAEITAMAPATITCVRCAGEARFDDDVRSYFAFASTSLGATLPADVRALHDALIAREQPAIAEDIEKTVEGHATVIRVRGKLSGQLRWPRILDGIEGPLSIDLAEIPAVDDAGIRHLDQALRGLPDSVGPIELDHAPMPLVESVIDLVHLGGRLKVSSAIVPAFCPACAVQRPAAVKIDRYVADRAAGREHHVACKRCNGPLQLAASAAFDRLCAAQRPPPARPASQAEPIAARTPSAAPSTARSFPWATLTIAGAAVVAVALIVVLGYHASPTPPAPSRPVASVIEKPVVVPSPMPAPEPAAGSAWQGSADLPPAWVERPFAIEGDTVYVLGHGAASASAESSLEAARRDATARLVDQLYIDLAGTSVHDFIDKRLHRDAPGADQAISDRFAAQHARDIAFERADLSTRKREGGTEAYVRYKLGKKQYDQLVASYRTTARFRGAEVAQVFPLLDTAFHAGGQLVVIGVEPRSASELAGIREGDVVRTLAGAPVVTVEAFRQASVNAWSNLEPRGRLALGLESAGAAKAVTLFKPATLQP